MAGKCFPGPTACRASSFLLPRYLDHTTARHAWQGFSRADQVARDSGAPGQPRLTRCAKLPALRGYSKLRFQRTETKSTRDSAQMDQRSYFLMTAATPHFRI